MQCLLIEMTSGRWRGRRGSGDQSRVSTLPLRAITSSPFGVGRLPLEP